MGTITGYSGKVKYPEIFYQFTSFLSPGIIYRCDLSTNEFLPSVSIFQKMFIVIVYILSTDKLITLSNTQFLYQLLENSFQDFATSQGHWECMERVG